MDKICQQCKQSFTQKENIRGSEQKYCSVKCRQMSAQTRMINRIKENVKQENEKETKPYQTIEGINKVWIEDNQGNIHELPMESGLLPIIIWQLLRNYMKPKPKLYSIN